jgi:thiamine phosphate synthase YjbQ (UPF0047 family)
VPSRRRRTHAFRNVLSKAAGTTTPPVRPIRRGVVHACVVSTCGTTTARREGRIEEGDTMRSFRKVIPLHVKARMAFVNITPQVQAALAESGIREGLCLVNAMHITASVFINDDEPGLHEDYARWLEQLAPFDSSPERYHHNRTGARWSWRSPTARSTSDHGNRSSTASSTAAARNAS